MDLKANLLISDEACIILIYPFRMNTCALASISCFALRSIDFWERYELIQTSVTKYKFTSCSVVSILGQLVGVRSGIPGEETFVMSFRLV